MSESSGAGIHISDLGIDESFYLGSLTSIFQAEVFATLIGGLNMIPTEISGKKIYICSDSEASIKALSSPTVTSKMVKDGQRMQRNTQSGGSKKPYHTDLGTWTLRD